MSPTAEDMDSGQTQDFEILHGELTTQRTKRRKLDCHALDSKESQLKNTGNFTQTPVRLDTFPRDIWLLILPNSTRDDLKALRLTCKAFETTANEILFSYVGISRFTRDRESFISIITTPRLAKHVREIVWYNHPTDLERSFQENIPALNNEHFQYYGIRDLPLATEFTMPPHLKDSDFDEFINTLTRSARSATWLSNLPLPEHRPDPQSASSLFESDGSHPGEDWQETHNDNHSSGSELVQIVEGNLHRMPNLTSLFSVPMHPDRTVHITKDGYEINASVYSSIGWGWGKGGDVLGRHLNQSLGFYYLFLPLMLRNKITLDHLVAGIQSICLTKKHGVRGFSEVGFPWDQVSQFICPVDLPPFQYQRPFWQNTAAFSKLKTIELRIPRKQHPEEYLRLHQMGRCLRAAADLESITLFRELSDAMPVSDDLETDFRILFSQSAHETNGRPQTFHWKNLKELKMYNIDFFQTTLLEFLRIHSSTILHLSITSWPVYLETLMRMAKDDALNLQSLSLYPSRQLSYGDGHGCAAWAETDLLEYLGGWSGSGSLLDSACQLWKPQVQTLSFGSELIFSRERSAVKLSYVVSTGRSGAVDDIGPYGFPAAWRERLSTWRRLGHRHDKSGEYSPVMFPSSNSGPDIDVANFRDEPPWTAFIESGSTSPDHSMSPRWSWTSDEAGKVWYWQSEDGLPTSTWKFKFRDGRFAYGWEPLEFFDDWDETEGDVVEPTPYQLALTISVLRRKRAGWLNQTTPPPGAKSLLLGEGAPFFRVYNNMSKEDVETFLIENGELFIKARQTCFYT